MTLATLYECRKQAQRYRDITAELRAVYNTAHSVTFSDTPKTSGARGTSNPTEQAALRVFDLEEELAAMQGNYLALREEIETWMGAAKIPPDGCAGIRLFFIVGMDWEEIDKTLRSNKWQGPPRSKAKTTKALKAAGILSEELTA